MSNLEFRSTEELKSYIHSLLVEHPNIKIDISEVCDYHHSYRNDGKRVYWGDEEVKKADIDSFVICLTMTFAKDKNKCYAGAKPLRSADAASFHSLNWTYAKDRNHVWTLCGIIKEADANSFQICDSGMYFNNGFIYPYGYGKDCNFVFYYDCSGKPTIIKAADPKTFCSLNDGLYGMDSQSVFYGKKKLNKASPNSWIKVSALHSKDANRCFYLNREIKGADPTTFFVETRKDGWDIYAKDKKHYYLWGEEVSQEEYEKRRNI